MTLGRRSIVIGVVAAILVLLLWWFLLWSPQRKKIDDAKARTDTAQQQIGQLRVTLSRLQELKRTEALKRSQIEALRVAVPDQPNLAQFILDANDAANKAGIDFLSVTPSPPATAAAGGGTAAGAPAAINLAMSITGGYFQVLDFVNRLTDLPRIVVIDNLSLAAGDSSNMTVSITARMFTTSAAPVAPSTTVAAAPTTTVPGVTTTTSATPAAPTTTGAP
ncbi:MAG TPA: type 4a pilus biogenesis protein PilO [Acidimicrobiales bacterium]|jgi:type IV pilus assembly protein PilO|nr:type 4a pilus biogenesis protein PilO [Acidimicrobiales bacterium]